MLWDQVGDVVVDGDGVQLPSGAPFIQGVAPPAAPLIANVQATWVQVGLRLNGQQAQASGQLPGVFSMVQLDPVSLQPLADPDPRVPGFQTTAATPASTGPVSASTWLSPGTWRVEFYGLTTGGMPGGSVILGTVTVPGATTYTFDAETTAVGVSLMVGGSAAPAVSGNRGRVLLGAESPTLPGQGPPRVDVTLWAGAPVDINWQCLEELDCGLPETPWQHLWTGLLP